MEVSQAGHPAVKKESSPTGQPVSQERRTPRGDVEAGAGDGPVPKSTPKRTAPSRVTAKVDSANTPQRKGESGTVPRSETLGDIPEQLDANVRPGTAVTARICHSYNNIREEEGRDPAEIGKVLHQKVSDPSPGHGGTMLIAYSIPRTPKQHGRITFMIGRRVPDYFETTHRSGTGNC